MAQRILPVIPRGDIVLAIAGKRMTHSFESFLREQIAIDIEANGLTLQRSIMQRALGASFGGSVIQPGRFLVSMSREASVLGRLIVEAMQKVLSSISVAYDEELIAQLLEIFDSEFEAVFDGMRRGFSTEYSKISGHESDSGRFESHAEKIRRARKHEIKLLVQKNMKDETQRKPAPNINIQGSNIGFVQSGDTNLVEGTTVSIGPTETKELREALQAIAEKLGYVESLSETEKLRLRDVARNAEAELAKPKPNGMRLRALLSTISTGIKGIVTLADLYKALEVAHSALSFIK